MHQLFFLSAILCLPALRFVVSFEHARSWSIPPRTKLVLPTHQYMCMRPSASDSLVVCVVCAASRALLCKLTQSTVFFQVFRETGTDSCFVIGSIVFFFFFQSIREISKTFFGLIFDPNLDL